MIRKIATTVVVLALMAAAAQAGLVVSVVQDTVNVPTIAGDTAYNVYVNGTNGDMMAAFDANFNGPMAQAWEYTSHGNYNNTTPEFNGYYQAPYTLVNANNDDSLNDSFFWVTDANCLVVLRGAAEDNDKTGAKSTNDYQEGMGTYLDYGFALYVDQRTSSLEVAHIVVPNGQTVRLDGTISDENANLYSMNDIVVGATPEPVTMSLLALGGLALLRRRHVA